MITKAVTEDLYGNTYIYRWKIYTFSEKVSCKCSECGKRITKSFSFQYQGEPSKEDYDSLRKREEEWLAEEHICNKCLKEACKSERGVLDRDEIDSILTVIRDREQRVREAKDQVSLFCNELSKKIKGKVCLYEDKEYAISYVSSCDFDYYIEGSKIDHNKPWSTTETDIYITDKGIGFGNRAVSAKVEDVTFTDEVFADRRKKLKELDK